MNFDDIELAWGRDQHGRGHDDIEEFTGAVKRYGGAAVHAEAFAAQLL